MMATLLCTWSAERQFRKYIQSRVGHLDLQIYSQPGRRALTMPYHGCVGICAWLSAYRFNFLMIWKYFPLCAHDVLRLQHCLHLLLWWLQGSETLAAHCKAFSCISWRDYSRGWCFFLKYLVRFIRESNYRWNFIWGNTSNDRFNV